jgi:hypothetical protein
VPVPEALGAVRRRTRRESVHCLALRDRFTPAGVLPDASFASFAPDGLKIAVASPRGIEIYDRSNRTRTAVTPPGFTIAADAWHPSGEVLIASGPAADGSGPYLHAITAAGMARLLPDHPGAARAACFSPDGKKVAFTYVNRFVHQLCMADWTGAALVSPLNLFPVDAQNDPHLSDVLSSLAWYETRGFSADGQRLYFASDRRAGMLNISVHYVNLARGTRHRVTYDEGVADGAVLSPDNDVLYASTTRAREPAFLTMVSGPGVPSFLGFVAGRTLYEQLAEKRLAVVSNGDVIASDPAYGLHARIVGSRRPLVRRGLPGVPGGEARLVACSMSPDGTDLATAVHGPQGASVVLLHRKPRAVPPAAAIRATPSPPGTAPLSNAPITDINRVIAGREGGSANVILSGELANGNFQISFDNFSSDGVHFFGGSAAFQTAAGGFRHLADVRRVNLESQEEVRVFYEADVRVDWQDAGLPTSAPVTDGRMASLSRSGDMAVAWDGVKFAPQDGWTAGNRGPRPVPGAKRCPTRTPRGA